LEDYDHDGGASSDTDNDNNYDDSKQGHGGNDGDSSNEEEEYLKQYSPINPGNVHKKNPFDWNKIDDEVINGIDEHVVVGSIGNMYVNEGQYIGFGEFGYGMSK
jgi:hypothetical protein